MRETDELTLRIIPELNTCSHTDGQGAQCFQLKSKHIYAAKEQMSPKTLLLIKTDV
jgi:hypothetical protein